MPGLARDRWRALRAEDRVAPVRLLIILFNVGVYLTLLDRSVGVPWLAHLVIAVAVAYAVTVVALRPHRRLPALQSSWFTTVSDGLLITLWLAATGGIHSPFYLLWFVSLIAVAFRFGLWETITAACLYAGLYVGLVAGFGQLAAHAVDMAIRVVYIGFAAALAGLLTRETTRLSEAKDAMHRVADAVGVVTRELDLDRTLRRVVSEAMKLVHADRGAVYMLDAERTELVCAHSVGLSAGYLEARTRLFRTLPGAPVLGGAPFVHILDAASDERMGELGGAAVREGFHTYAAFPLRAGSEAVGIMTLYRDRVAPFSTEELGVASALAEHAASALSNAGLVRELKESEERLRRVVESAPVILFTVDREGTLLVARGSSLAAPGLPASVEGESVFEVYEDHPDFLQLVRRALAGEAFTALVPFGESMFETHFAPVRAGSGELEGASGVAVDVTAREAAAAERSARLHEAEELERLRELDRFKTLFMNTAAHELRTPLTPIKLQLHLLRGRDLDRFTPRQREAMEILDRNISRLTSLVEDLLEGTRLEAGGLALERRTVDMNRIVHEAVESFEEAASRAGVRLEARLRPNLLVTADPKRLIQVMFNLLSNALKFTPEGGDIVVETERDGRQAVVRVRDTGAGLTEEQAARLFRPFSQVHDTMERTRAGTGLGLYISRSIVALHGGEIQVESPGPGKGSTFTFTIPVEAAGPPPLDPGAWPEAGAAPGAAAPPAPAAETESPLLSRAERDRLEQRARELV